MRSEIRESQVRKLLEKVRKNNYAQYIKQVRIEHMRSFHGQTINFDFPVTALIGPNGSGKSTILNAAACAYKNTNLGSLFKKSRVGDEGMNNWKLEFEVVDKATSPKGTVRCALEFKGNGWHRVDQFTQRVIRILTLNRTVPAVDNPLFTYRRKITTEGGSGKSKLVQTAVKDIGIIKEEAERILNKSLENFKIYEFTFGRNPNEPRRKIKTITERLETFEDGTERIRRRTIEVPPKPVVPAENKVHQYLYVGEKNGERYSEFNFGSGESSIFRLVADIEALPDGALVLIEEIENGLHPIAVERVVEYLLSVAERKNIQTIFTTHSDYALNPLPNEAIWSCLDGEVRPGKVPVEVLRFLTSKVDQKLAVFVEDVFAKEWIQYILRQAIPDRLSEIGVYPVRGDGNAVSIHESHGKNPSISFKSVCFIDGDSRQQEDEANGVYRLPGAQDPEFVVFSAVLDNLSQNIAQLTLGMHQPSTKQASVEEVIRSVFRLNRDSHLLFTQVADKLDYLPEAVVRGAFLAVWMKENPDETNRISDAVKGILA